MNPAIWLMGAAIGLALGLLASLVRRPWGLVANLALAGLGGGLGAWLGAVFGLPPEARAALAGAGAAGAAVFVALLWSLKR